MSGQHSLETRRAALKLAARVGPGAAADELGVPRGTVSRWIHEAKYGGRRAERRSATQPGPGPTCGLVEVIPAQATASVTQSADVARLELPAGMSLLFGTLPPAAYLVDVIAGLAGRAQ
jgi:transposase-like protein